MTVHLATNGQCTNLLSWSDQEVSSMTDLIEMGWKKHEKNLHSTSYKNESLTDFQSAISEFFLENKCREIENSHVSSVVVDDRKQKTFDYVCSVLQWKGN